MPTYIFYLLIDTKLIVYSIFKPNFLTPTKWMECFLFSIVPC